MHIMSTSMHKRFLHPILIIHHPGFTRVWQTTLLFYRQGIDVRAQENRASFSIFEHSSKSMAPNARDDVVGFE